MSYLVFALKWRPKNFDEIIGQAHIVNTLKSALQNNRLAHAYLFSGPRGIGKTSTARILAKALNCKEGPTVNPCGKCPSCLEIAQGRSLDVIEIDGASNRGIDEIRTLRENVKFAPVMGKYKIYIIDEVHQITTDGFNALLKTLEEPPEFVKFIFATTHPHKVIPTILSRCQRLDFRRIPIMEIISQLERIIKEEQISVDKEVLFAIAKASDGSLRDAESILDQLASFTKDKISLKDVVSVLGMVEQEALFAITEQIINKDPKAALAIFNQIIDEGKDIGAFLANLIEHFRNLMVAKVSHADSKLIDLPQDICDRLLTQAQSFSLEEIFSCFTTMVNTQEMCKRLDSMRIPLEISLVKLSHDKKPNPALNISPAMPVSENKVVLPRHQEARPFAAAVKKEEPAPEINAQAPVITFDELKDKWRSLLDGISRNKMYVSTYLHEGSPLKLEGTVLTVAFPKNYSLHKESLERKENQELIERIAQETCGIAIKFRFILSDEKKDTTDNPLLKTALETFNGRVVKEE